MLLLKVEQSPSVMKTTLNAWIQEGILEPRESIILQICNAV